MSGRLWFTVRGSRRRPYIARHCTCTLVFFALPFFVFGEPTTVELFFSRGVGVPETPGAPPPPALATSLAVLATRTARYRWYISSPRSFCIALFCDRRVAFFSRSGSLFFVAGGANRSGIYTVRGRAVWSRASSRSSNAKGGKSALLLISFNSLLKLALLLSSSCLLIVLYGPLLFATEVEAVVTSCELTEVASTASRHCTDRICRGRCRSARRRLSWTEK